MKWVTALDLDRWADGVGSRVTLSEIVSRLVRATATDVQSFRFPTGDSAQIPGYDGRLTARGVAPYIPDGESVWEFGTNADYYAKANSDFDERTAKPKGIACADTTFVFVTPRKWARAAPSIEEWQAEKKAGGIWKDIKVIDAVALEEWLSRYPAVAAYVARFVLGKVTEVGVQSTDEFWEEYAARFKPGLTEKVLLCTREEQAKRLLENLAGTAQELSWRADSPDEVVAFAIAAIRSADEATRKFLEARTLVLDDANAAKQLARQPNRIFIARAGALQVSGLLANYNPTIVPFGRDSVRGNMEALKRPSARELGVAIESMGIPAERAYQLARACGRSVTILRRRIPNGDAGKPPWADGSRTLLPALLAGAWDASVDADKQILQTLAKADRYETYEATLRPALKFQDPPVDREGDVWKIRAPVDAFVNIGYLLTAADFEALAAVAKEVFSEVDPGLDEPDENEPFALPTRASLKHSEWIRDGLATTLLQIAALHDEAEVKISGTTPPAFVDAIVQSLPGLAKDRRVIASLKRQLPLLMEAAPRPLLSALERLLEGKSEALLPIFQKGGLFSRTSPHTYLLWALEALAWDPEYLSGIASVLAKLARVDPGGETTNRPINSLREIFLAWHPGTNASLELRLAILNQLISAEPQVGWDLLVKLLPENSSVSHNTSQPKLREAGASEREVLTWGLVRRTYREIVHRILDLAGNNTDRLSVVIRSMSNFEPSLRQSTYGLLKQVIESADVPTKTKIWEPLLEEVNRHKAYPDAQWSLKGHDLDELDALLDLAKPQDVIDRHKWLFESDFVDLPIADVDKRLEAIADARVSAIAEIQSVGGNSALLKLVENVTQPYLVGVAAVKCIDDAKEVLVLIEQSLGRSAPLDTFARTLSGEASRKFQSEWPKLLFDASRTDRWNADQIASLLLGWQDTTATWDFAEAFGEQVDESFWLHKRPWWISGTPQELERAAQKYLKVGRPTAALEALYREIERLPTHLTFQLLDAAITELNRKDAHPTHMFVHELGEIFDRLRKIPEIDAVQIARREYAYLPLLDSQRRPQLTLHTLMAQNAAFFVQVLSDVFKEASAEAVEASEERRARARAGYQLLTSFHEVPGFQNGQAEREKLESWITEARTLAERADRARIADEYIGHLLAHAPADPEDQGWPHKGVRELLEKFASDDIERGIRIERFNMRGVYGKSAFEGGKQERALAENARRWAKLAKGHPRTVALLGAIAREWDAMADSEDVRARQDEMRYE